MRDGSGSTATPEAAYEALLFAARDAITAAVTGREPRHHPSEDARALRGPGAAFVTLRSPDGSLRGCIGELEARRPLVESVRACAESAALRDPRFHPVTEEELGGLHIGISVLTPSVPLRRPTDLEIGRHGLLIERDAHRGVLLPEVATEQRWDVETFLAATCRKAGLAADAWRQPGTRVWVFETIKIAEPPHPGPESLSCR